MTAGKGKGRRPEPGDGPTYPQEGTPTSSVPGIEVWGAGWTDAEQQRVLDLPEGPRNYFLLWSKRESEREIENNRAAARLELERRELATHVLDRAKEMSDQLAKQAGTTPVLILDHARDHLRRVAGIRIAEEILNRRREGRSIAEDVLDSTELGSLPAPDPLIVGVLPRHSYAVLRGRDQTFKSFLALAWGLSLATGTPWLGREVEQVNVLYIAGEGAYGLQKRIDAWEERTGVAVEYGQFVILPRSVDMFSGAEIDELIELIRDGQFGLVIFDTLRRISGAAETNSDRDMGKVVDHLDRVKRATVNGSVLVVAHTQRADGDTRGSTAIEDDADVVWSVRRKGLVVTAKLEKAKDGPDGDEIKLEALETGESLVLVEDVGSGIVLRPVTRVPRTTKEWIGDALTYFQNTTILTDGVSTTQIVKLVEAYVQRLQNTGVFTGEPPKSRTVQNEVPTTAKTTDILTEALNPVTGQSFRPARFRLATPTPGLEPREGDVVDDPFGGA